MSDKTAQLVIGCAGSVSIDGHHVGRLTVAAYELLTTLVPDEYPFDNFEHGDSLVFEMRLTDAIARGAISTFARDTLWNNPPPLIANCDHDLELLPIIEPRFTVQCRKCGGLDVQASQAIGSTNPGTPEYLILADSTVRPLP